MDESKKAEIKNALMVALQPFHEQKFITLDTTIAGWNLSISKNCWASNIPLDITKNDCCNTVTEFIKAFNSAIARIYKANSIPIGTPLRDFVGIVRVSIDANFFNTCIINSDNVMSNTVTMDDVNVFLSLIGKDTNYFEAFQRVSRQEYESNAVGRDQSEDPPRGYGGPSRGYGGRNRRRRSSKRKYSKRRSSKRKYSKRR
jgi:hypothetical protein